jgi:hypothetical protein
MDGNHAVAVGSVRFEVGKDLGSRGTVMPGGCSRASGTTSLPVLDLMDEQQSDQSVKPASMEKSIDSKRTDTAACVWRCGVAKAIDVLAHGLWIDPDLSQSLFEQPCIVHTLPSRKDLLSAHKRVVRVGKFLCW